MIKGIVFDFDGLILDTEMPAFQSWQEIFAEHGCSLALEDWSVVLGGSGAEFDTCAHLEQQYGRPIDREAIRARRTRRKLELITGQSVLPGVLDYLDEADRVGLKSAVASSATRSWVEEHLQRLGILQRFDVIVTAEDVGCRVKPAPDIFLAALEALGLRSEEAIVLEDSPNGMRAARAAGIFCVAVPNALTARLPFEADLRLSSLANMPLAELVAHAEQGAVARR